MIKRLATGTVLDVLSRARDTQRDGRVSDDNPLLFSARFACPATLEARQPTVQRICSLDYAMTVLMF